jgi:hypothetical protein
MYGLHLQAQLDEATTEKGFEVRQHDDPATYGRDGAMDHQSDTSTSRSDGLVHRQDELSDLESSTVATHSRLTKEIRMSRFLLATCSTNIFPPGISLLVVSPRIQNS